MSMQDYNSRLSDPASRKFETFSYLPAMTKDEIRKQVEYLVKKGLNPAIEHTEPQYLMDSYWYMWKLPMFGETDVDKVLAECEACRQANPDNPHPPDRLQQLHAVARRFDGHLPREKPCNPPAPLRGLPTWKGGRCLWPGEAGSTASLGSGTRSGRTVGVLLGVLVSVVRGGRRSEVKEEPAEGRRGTRTELAAPHHAVQANATGQRVQSLRRRT